MTGSTHNMLFDLMHVTGVDWLRAAVILVGTSAAAQLLRRAVRRWLHRSDCEVGLSDLIARFVGYGLVLLGIVYALMALRVQVGPLLGALGVGGLALALATKGLLEDLFGGFVLQARRPFHRGDEISIGDHRGRVEDINLRAVILRSQDGERFLIPSSTVLRETIVNLTVNQARRTVLGFNIGVAVDVVPVVEALRTAVQAAEGVHADPPVLVQLRQVGESGIELAIKVWHGAEIAAQHAAIDASNRAAIDALGGLGVSIEAPRRRVLAA